MTRSQSYTTILNPGSALSSAEDLKRRKYTQLVADFQFVAVAVETSGVIGSAGCSFLLRSAAAFRGPPMISARLLAFFNRFQSPSSGQRAGHDVLIMEIYPDLTGLIDVV